jgi:hypothetical protein
MDERKRKERRKRRRLPDLSIRFILVIIVFVVIAGGVTYWRCDGRSLSEAEAAAIECGALVGDWTVHITWHDISRKGEEIKRTSGVARFSVDGDGRVYGEDIDTVRGGRSYCRQSGTSFTLNAGRWSAMKFELTAPGELRQIGRRGSTGLMFRKNPSSCPF